MSSCGGVVEEGLIVAEESDIPYEAEIELDRAYEDLAYGIPHRIPVLEDIVDETINDLDRQDIEGMIEFHLFNRSYGALGYATEEEFIDAAYDRQLDIDYSFSNDEIEIYAIQYLGRHAICYIDNDDQVVNCPIIEVW